MRNSARPFTNHHANIDIEQIRRAYSASGKHDKLSPVYPTRPLWKFMGFVQRWIGRGGISLPHSSRRPMGLLSRLRTWFGSRHSRHKIRQGLPRLLAGSWAWQLRRSFYGSRQQVVGYMMQIQPSSKFFPRLLVLPWWMVFIVFGVTAVVSVSYSEGEEHQVTEETSHENQGLMIHEPDEELSEEASLVQQLQSRLKELQEREQRLQQKQERIESLQRDVEELAARQAKEAERLEKKAAELEGKSKQPIREDPALTHLVKVYNAMDPEEAALRIEEMDETLALEILSGIKDKKAAVVLAGVKPKKAATLSQGLRNFGKTPTK